MSFWKNLWYNTFGDPFPTFEGMRRSSGGGRTEGIVDHDDSLSPPPPEPSCFAKGIATSLRDEPREWVEESGSDYTFYTSEAQRKVKLSIRHNQTQARLVWYDRWERLVYGRKRCIFSDHVVINGAPVCDTDAAHILSTIRAHPLGQYKVELDREKAEQEQQAAVKAHFEHLGCPPSS